MEHRCLTFQWRNRLNFVLPESASFAIGHRLHLYICGSRLEARGNYKKGSQCDDPGCAFAHSNKDTEENIQKSGVGSIFPYSQWSNFKEEDESVKSDINDEGQLEESLMDWAASKEYLLLRLYLTEPEVRKFIQRRIIVRTLLKFAAVCYNKLIFFN